MVEVQDGDTRFFLCHYPLAVWNGQRSGVRQLFGHVHRGMPGNAMSLNVGIEEIGVTPIGRERILARMAELGRPSVRRQRPDATCENRLAAFGSLGDYFTGWSPP